MSEPRFCIYEDCDQEPLYCEGHVKELAAERTTKLEKSLGIANGYLRKGVEIDDQLIAEINRLRDALGKYGDCLPSCGIIGLEGRVYRVCTCGYNKALREVGDE